MQQRRLIDDSNSWIALVTSIVGNVGNFDFNVGNFDLMPCLKIGVTWLFSICCEALLVAKRMKDCI